MTQTPNFTPPFLFLISLPHLSLSPQACEYGRIRMVLEDAAAIKASGPAIIALEPHDVLPLRYVRDCEGARWESTRGEALGQVRWLSLTPPPFVAASSGSTT
jgi:hypothetical protein